jgi:HAD superfamily hydrolase (TIGR01490 family)
MTTGAYAFFDVDGTLLRVKSMFHFAEHLCLHSRFVYEVSGPSRLQALRTEMQRLEQQAAGRDELNAAYYRIVVADVSTGVIERAATEWYGSLRRQLRDPFFRVTRARLQQHAREGVAPVLVSGSFRALLAPIAAELGVEQVLCTELHIANERFTGRISSGCIDADKGRRLRAFLRANDVCADGCFAYGDHISDVPLLQGVGHAFAVGDDPDLTQVAVSAGWSVLSLADEPALAMQV